MNAWLAAAAAVAFATFLVHTFVGGREIAAPLLAAKSLPRVPRYTAYYCWHMVTLLLAAMAAALGWTALHANAALTVLMLALASGFALLSLGLVLRFRVSPWYLPQWTFFVVIAALTAAGLWGG